MGKRIVSADWRFFEGLLTEEKTVKNTDSLPGDAKLTHIRHSTASLRVGLIFESDEWSDEDELKEVDVEFVEIRDEEEE